MPRRKKELQSSDDDDSKQQKPVQRNAANARERSRMRILSKAFVKLKTTLPWVPADTKLSKLDTLRLASSYIAHLQQVLDAEDEEGAELPSFHPLNLTWPFSFTGGKASPSSDGKSPDHLKSHMDHDEMSSCSDMMI
ncbi:transcription factor 21-like [Mizuhopecten yessoensis]|uniref:Transcription factor 21 n=1 Tax=Mizuhopecten yessoensis TaxID=6573 RepID=A0A210R062_MIZYE|nr:transcription factor 21-like [Mizuhopecten yessoensis]OWF54379.1 Transcription factor 21 [Mizuhopecten yessoensis]